MNFNQSANALLDDVYLELERLDSELATTTALSRLFEGLRELRHRAGAESWPELRQAIQAHPVRELIHEDPMTRRSFEKPRGYAGDAVLLDYIYGEPVEAQDGPSPRARAVQRYATGRPAAAAVRHRRQWLAFQIDRAADRALAEGREGARVLSVACGHLREGRDSVALQTGAISECVAVDADARSLAEVERAFAGRVQPVQMSVARLLARAERLGEFDLVYSAGLYDYLDDALARRLTARLFERLRPGGRLIVTNFLPQVADVGYMETFMGWELIYRDLDGVRDFAGDIDPDRIRRLEVSQDPFGAVGTLVVDRQGAAS
ncbi:MAG: class I SAM-dependent methyltransferase [Planctomycetota bacterium]|jgi:SAM-dependent methyltransferase